MNAQTAQIHSLTDITRTTIWAMGDEALREALREYHRTMKTVWVPMAEALLRVRHERLWKAWGFSGFNDYVEAEIPGVSVQGARSMMGAAEFVKERRPDWYDEVLETHIGDDAFYVDRGALDYDTINVMMRTLRVAGASERKAHLLPQAERLVTEAFEGSAKPKEIRRRSKRLKKEAGLALDLDAQAAAIARRLRACFRDALAVAGAMKAQGSDPSTSPLGEIAFRQIQTAHRLMGASEMRRIVVAVREAEAVKEAN